ncbi:hypothetical protein [Paraburkholderia metrosideri]|uniref:Transmembrane protein n=1 Tax=Paraburkholderia metrosideri TaxID=580937 RepID=A0ABN7IJC0_9BURK|nr:hypothetical protein [Paraburkholderia metrosideri]CAD6559484.1 hypothetical protein LMG28140_06639 [Paraburkholderia metrosideri]
MRLLSKIIGIFLLFVGFFIQKNLHYEGEPDMQHLHTMVVWGVFIVAAIFLALGRKKKKEPARPRANNS